MSQSGLLPSCDQPVTCRPGRVTDKSERPDTTKAGPERSGPALSCVRQDDAPPTCSMTASATSRMVRRRSIDVFWIQRNDSGSVRPILVMSRPLARSTRLRVSNRSARSATSDSSALICAYREIAISTAGSRSAGLNGLIDVRHRAGVARALDELLLRERRQQDHGRQVRLADALGRRDAVEDGHLHVHHHDVGLQLGDQLHGRLAVAGLADHVEARVTERLDDVHADQRLVLGHDRSPRRTRRGRGRRLARRSRSAQVEGVGGRLGGFGGRVGAHVHRVVGAVARFAVVAPVRQPTRCRPPWPDVASKSSDTSEEAR